MKSCSIIFLFITSVTLLSPQAHAGILYTAESIASISLNSASPSDISFVNVSGNYDAFAIALSDGSLVVDGASTPFDRSGSFQTLSDLLFPFTSTFPSPFDSVNAINGGADAHGRNENFSSVNTARFKAEVFGHVTDPVENAYSRVYWNILVAFENISSHDISFGWDLNYLLINTAVSEPGGTAFSMSRVRAQQGTLVNGERNVDSTILSVAAAACGATTNCLPGNNDGIPFSFNYHLGAGEIGFLNFSVVAEGNASVVPEPLTIWLFITTLIALIGFRKRITTD